MSRAVTPILRFEAATLGYSRKPVVTGLSGVLHEGEALALIGPNGSGKTTFLRSILAEADILAGRVDVTAGAIGHVPQSADLDLEFPVTAEEVVAMGLYGELGWFRRLARAHRVRVQAALERVGMAERADTRFGRLSGGQRQRILLARAIVARPRLILLDEPFNGLDQPNRDALIDLIRSVKAEGVGVVVSTHDLSLATLTCERALLLAGRQVAFGPLRDVLTPENLACAYGAGSDVLVEASVGVQAHTKPQVHGATLIDTATPTEVAGQAADARSEASQTR